MIDESSPCGCRRIKPHDAAQFTQVVWCPDHNDGCPGPWSPSVISEQDYPDDDIDPTPEEEDEWEREEGEWDRAMQECGKVPAAEGGCLMAGTEYCDFECPFRDEEEEERERCDGEVIYEIGVGTEDVERRMR